MIYFGFDLGDGESCISWSRDLSIHEPMPVAVNGAMSFPSAVGLLCGETVIGTHAVGNANVDDLRVCFKRHFLDNQPEIDRTIKRFVKGVLDVLRQNKELSELIDDENESCFIVGCPAGWTKADRERYRQLMMEAGMKNVRIASESRAAFENALRCNKDKMETQLIQDSVLVIDIGSSTLDLAYVCDGEEHGVEVVGDVKLGGGLMDEMIVRYGIEQLGGKAGDELQQFLDQNPGWLSRVMFVAREMKEQYFTNEDYYFENNESLQNVVKIFGAKKAYKLPLKLSSEIVETYVISRPHPLLDKQSFESKLRNMLKTVHQKVKQREPRVVILTGGPSRMKFFQEMCIAEFKQSKVIISKEPEYDISRGLSYAGNVDEKAAAMLKEIKTYVSGNEVEAKVTRRVPELIDTLSEELSQTIIHQCVVPALQQWKDNAGSETLDDLKERITVETDQFFRSDAGAELIAHACTPWTKSLMEEVQKDLDEIALKHKVNLNKLTSSNLAVDSGGDLDFDAAQSMSRVITAIVAVMTGIILAMVCGGTDTALIATGPLGIVIALVITAVAFFLGKNFVEDAVMKIPFPRLARKMFPEGTITKQKNIDKATQSIRENLVSNDELVSSLTGQVSRMIDDNLSKLVADTETQIVA